jgi:glycosyltransferase involved in cell wall biosynthesis
MAQGKYIALCEGDDYWTDPMKLQKQFDFMESNPDYSLCCHNSIIKNEITQKKTVFFQNRTNETLSPSQILLEGGGCMATASMFFRRKDINDFLLFKKECPVGDAPLSFCLASHGKVYYNNDIMSVYRYCSVGSWSRSHFKNQKSIEHLKKTIQWYEHLKNSAIFGEKEIIDVKISWLYLSLYFEARSNDLFFKNEYCKNLFKRTSFLHKTKLIVWCFFLGYISRLFKNNFVDKVINRIIGFSSIILLDKEKILKKMIVSDQPNKTQHT